MTEREKMLNGERYDSRDPELLEMYHRSKRLLQEYSNIPSTDGKRRSNVLKQLLGMCEEGVWIEKGFQCDYGKHISIGKNTFINYNCILVDDNLISIGDDCLLAPAVQIVTAEHPIHAAERIVRVLDGSTRYCTCTKPVKIGNRVWIGAGAIICPGVTIGDDTVIGAGSVVTRDIPAGVVAYGTPCKIIRNSTL